ncbi:MAG: hypothetical protein NTV94_02720 [Planctomycetota bacterium]|nr:hypothetical protein [Planctomycetota bacterium]
MALAALLLTGLAHGQACTGPTIIRRGPINSSDPWPRSLRSVNAAFDTVNNTLLVSGNSAAGDTTELWEWDGFAWTRLVSSEGAAPPPLIGAAAAYHEATGRFILFGGTLPNGTDSNRTYLWNGLFWDEPYFQDTPPDPLHDAALVYSPALNRAVLWGGIRNGLEARETWTWGLGGWQRVTTGTDQPRGGSLRNTAAYFPPLNAIAFCDPRDDATTPEPFGLWFFDASGWTQFYPPIPPPGAGAGFEQPTVYDPESATLLRLANGGPDSRTQRWVWGGDELWYFDRYMDPPLPMRIFDLATATDRFRKKILIVGRSSPDGDLELWEHDSTPGSIDVSSPVIEYGLNSNVFVRASGLGPLTFQWLRDGRPITDESTFEGTQSPAMSIDAASLRCSTFQLSCRVCGNCGCQTSSAIQFSFSFVGDFNVDGGVDGQDIEAFILSWEAGATGADVNCDGGIDGGDIESFFRCWADNCDR